MHFRPAPDFLDSVRETLTHHYADFSGRARRSEFWFFQLAVALVSFAQQLLSLGLLAIAGITENEMLIAAALGFTTVLSYSFSLGVLVPSLGLSVRRLHDVDRSGWFLLLWLIPCIGWIVLLIFWCTDSSPHANAWGPSPKYGQDDDDPMRHLEAGGYR